MAQLRPCSMSSSSCILRLLPPHLEEGLMGYLDTSPALCCCPWRRWRLGFT